MTPEEISVALADGTFQQRLMQETDISLSADGADKVQVHLAFPPWFHDNLTKKSKKYIIKSITKVVLEYASSYGGDDGGNAA